MGDALPILVLAVIAFGALVLRGPIGRAIADRMSGTPDRALDAGEFEALREELHGLRQQVSELAERQDFTERLLAQARERGQLSAPKEP